MLSDSALGLTIRMLSAAKTNLTRAEAHREARVTTGPASAFFTFIPITQTFSMTFYVTIYTYIFNIIIQFF